jgi:pimeloyl-ACP methyl ester carboxylesterase
MRARQPDRAGVVERDGVTVAYEVFGSGGPAVFLIPAAPITHARSWKAIVPTLARRFTVVTTDGLGTGRSDRPHTRERYSTREIAADLLAVLAAAEVDRAVLVAHCHATPWALLLAAEHAERVAGLVAIAPFLALAPPHPYAAAAEQIWTEPLAAPRAGPCATARSGDATGDTAPGSSSSLTSCCPSRIPPRNTRTPFVGRPGTPTPSR